VFLGDCSSLSIVIYRGGDHYLLNTTIQILLSLTFLHCLFLLHVTTTPLLLSKHSTFPIVSFFLHSSTNTTRSLFSLWLGWVTPNIMGVCFSKKKGSSSSASVSSSSVAAVSSAPKADPNISQVSNDRSGDSTNITHKVKAESGELKKEKKTVQATQDDQQVKEDEVVPVKKEIFLIKHRRSRDGRDSRSPPPQQDEPLTSSNEEAAAESLGNKATAGVGVRTSSCTKEEVDAILIQCGRLSRSASGNAASSSASASCDRGRKYSGSKRSYDFDRCENEVAAADVIENNDDVCGDERRQHHRQRHRRSPRPSSSPQGRRRTPSRERDQQQRSSSRERRVSRSPGRRSSEAGGATPATENAARNVNKPGKMVSVPPTVSSLVMDKSNSGGGESAPATAVKRISVKRNAGNEAVTVGSRSAASPRSQSPARANANAKTSNDNQQQPSLSRSSSRKAEHSPYRRNPLSEIDPNSLAYPQPLNNNNNSKLQNRNKKEIEGDDRIVLKDSAKVPNQVNIT
jgi:hypothetical protein